MTVKSPSGAFVVDGGELDDSDGADTFGSLKVNGDGTFTYDPNLSSLNLLQAENSAAGAFRYATTRNFDYFVVDKETSSRVLAQGAFTVKITNDLPTFAERFQYDETTQAYFLPNDLAFHLVMGTRTDSEGEIVETTQSYRIDLDDLFYDPDGDPITLHSVTDGPSELFTYTFDGNDVWRKKLADTTFAPTERHIYFERFGRNHASDSVDLYHDLDYFICGGVDGACNLTGMPATMHVGFVVTDGQLVAGDPKTIEARIGIDPTQTTQAGLNGRIRGEVISATPKASSWATVVFHDQLFTPQGTGLAPHAHKRSWTVESFVREPTLAGGDSQVVGGVEVDLTNGAFRRYHNLDLDASGGASELALPGLIFDSSTVDPRPVVQTVRPAQWRRPQPGSHRGHALLGRPRQCRGERYRRPTGYQDGLRPVELEQRPPRRVSGVDASQQYSRCVWNLPLGNGGRLIWDSEGIDPVSNMPIGDKRTSFQTRGKVPVIVNQPVTAGDFGSDSPAKRNFTPIFGQGWALEGVPTLFADDTLKPNAPFDDHILLSFPGEPTRVFQQYNGSGQFGYHGGEFTPVQPGTFFKQPEESATGASRSAERLRLHNERRHKIHLQRFVMDDGTNTVPTWLISEIKAPDAPPIVFTRLDAPATSNHGRLESITATDGSTTAFHYDANGYVDYLALPGARIVDFQINDGASNSALKGVLEEIIHDNQLANLPPGMTAPDKVRKFEYLTPISPVRQFDLNGDKRDETVQVVLLSRDEWHTTSTSTDPERSLQFAYDGFDLLSEIKLGRILAAAMRKPRTKSSRRPKSRCMSHSMPAMHFRPTTNSEESYKIDLRKASVTIDVPDLQRYNKTNREAEDFSIESITEYFYDQVGNLTRREVRAKQASQSNQQDSQLLGLESWTYDRWGAAKTYTDPLGRVTYYSYDYELPLGYADAISDISTSADDFPKYAPNDFRGNVVSVLDVAGNTAFEHETDDEKGFHGRVLKQIDSRGVVTEFEWDDAGRLRKQRTIRGQKDGQGNTETDDYVETWEYTAQTMSGVHDESTELLTQYVNPLGLVFDYRYDTKRRPAFITRTDGGIGGADPATSETSCTHNRYDAISGNLEAVTLRDGGCNGGSPAGEIVSIVNYVYDALGLLRQVATSEIDRTPDPDVIKELSRVQYNYDPDGMRSEIIVFQDETGTPFDDEIRTVNNYDRRGLLLSQWKLRARHSLRCLPPPIPPSSAKQSTSIMRTALLKR